MTLKHETFIICLTIVLLAGLTGCKKQEAVKISDTERIQGTWNGKELDTGGEGGEWRLIITGEQIKIDGPGPEDYSGTIILDETTNPKSARVTILECAAERYIGEVANAIYKFENDKLFIAASEPGSGTIPAYFEGNGNIRYYEYVKAQAK
ncbi:MAG: hypothetical protein JW787_06770 [Sedimentisphaerales bacterium]|nr:hypothetical protein [Sedimentisphaerales bacterium]